MLLVILLLASLALNGLMAFGVLSFTPTETENNKSSLSDDIEELEAENKTLTEGKTALEKEKATLTEEKAALEKQIADLSAELQALKDSGAAATTTIADLQNQLTEKQNELAAVTERLNFYEKYVVIVYTEDNNNLYHTYGCENHGANSTRFLAFNTKLAESEGYSPCPYCQQN